MLFRSTISGKAGSANEVSFKDAILDCLPPDGGLYIPSKVMDLRQFFLYMNEGITFSELVTTLAPALFDAGLNPVSSSRVAESAFDFEPEIKTLDENISILNLYNGPTGSFKDFGIAFFASVLEEIIRDKGHAMILSAVRGDDGLNLERAFHGRKGLISVMLYPSGPIHGLNPQSYVTNGGNIIPVQVKGNLDDCQALVNETINDRPFSKRHNITSANTINPLRLLPQAFYYLYAYIKIKKILAGDLFFSIPSGNFGNLISALYAWKAGLPVNGFIASMNANNSLGEFLMGGDFKPKPVIATNSPALDVGIPSNLSRLESFRNESPSVMRNMVFPASVGNDETFKAMEEAWKLYGELLDPHAAVALSAARNFLKAEKHRCSHVIVLATGHPAREAAIIRSATGQNVEIPEKLQLLKKDAAPVAIIDSCPDALKSAIASCV